MTDYVHNTTPPLKNRLNIQRNMEILCKGCGNNDKMRKKTKDYVENV